MIGVIAKESEKEIAGEFFELFKTPWAFYREDEPYDVILTTTDVSEDCKAALMVIYGSFETCFDRENKIQSLPHESNVLLEGAAGPFPVYGKSLIFDHKYPSLIRVQGTEKVAGFELHSGNAKVLRIGFDLFQEVHFLLSTGQPAEHADIPTLDVHIALLRDWMLRSGIPVVEIPPFPEGYGFIACLTHDVDFAGIRRHVLDHTFFGFVYRALFLSVARFLRGELSGLKLLQNWTAVLSLPLVYLGIIKDFLMQFDRYLELEKGLASTFFIIPYKNDPGQSDSGQAPRKRASRYDITDIQSEVHRLVSHGCEISLHGIDAWNDPEKGRNEFNRISLVVGNDSTGVRMHWLYYDYRSPQLLEMAGFHYDSTFGYNDAVGYRGGTAQVFRPVGAKTLLELPMHIQDTAMFYPSRMGLTNAHAKETVERLLVHATEHGGVLTINWHERSVGPERFWDDFYISLLEEMKKYRAWFGTGRQVIQWFQKRRSVSFQKVELSQSKIQIRLKAAIDASTPELILRIHRPDTSLSSTATTPESTPKRKTIDIPFIGELDTEIPLVIIDDALGMTL